MKWQHGVVLAMLAVAGCRSGGKTADEGPPKVDNAATRYADSLRGDVKKAHEAAALARQVNAERQRDLAAAEAGN